MEGRQKGKGRTRGNYSWEADCLRLVSLSRRHVWVVFIILWWEMGRNKEILLCSSLSEGWKPQMLTSSCLYFKYVPSCQLPNLVNFSQFSLQVETKIWIHWSWFCNIHMYFPRQPRRSPGFFFFFFPLNECLYSDIVLLFVIKVSFLCETIVIANDISILGFFKALFQGDIQWFSDVQFWTSAGYHWPHVTMWLVASILNRSFRQY